MINIIDYGAGNLFSVKNALDHLGIENRISSQEEDLINADKLILPGVGAFPDAMEKLNAGNLVDVIKKEAKRKPLLGICLGMQILFEKGYEFGEVKGLGLIEGYVDKIVAEDLKIPHVGWDDVSIKNQCTLSKNIEKGDMVYYVHSYKASTDEKNICLYSEYGQLIPGLVFKDNVFGCQFHPEKSGQIGLKILKNFSEL